MPSRWRCAARSGRSPTRSRPRAPRPRTRPRAPRPPARRSARRSCSLLPSDPGLGRLEAGEEAELLVGQPAREIHEVLARVPLREPAADEAVHRVVEALGEHPPEQRATDLGDRPEAAADEDVVRLLALARLVAGSGALEAEVADPVLGARVGAAVEVQ